VTTALPGPARPQPRARRRLLDRTLLHAPVTAVDQVAARMIKIRLGTAGLAMPAWIPGQQVRVVVGNAPPPKNWIAGQTRTYSVWQLTPEYLELLILDHGQGPGISWARQASPGPSVTFTKPQGPLVARPSGSHVFIGEETAAVAFGAILRALPADQQALAIIEVDEPDSQLPIPGDVRWHHRHGHSAANSATLLRAVRDTALPPPGIAYLAGEARTIQALRSHLIHERGWPRQSVITKPFWTPGKKGME
jgi:NADPH-dependent ferric siderophore reductase